MNNLPLARPTLSDFLGADEPSEPFELAPGVMLWAQRYDGVWCFSLMVDDEWTGYDLQGRMGSHELN